MKIKQKVLEVEEVMLKEGISKEKIKRINLKEAFEGCITLAEVGKVIDDWWRDKVFSIVNHHQIKELKQKLNIK